MPGASPRSGRNDRNIVPRAGFYLEMRRVLTLIAVTTALLLATTGSASANHYDHLLAPTSTCGGQMNTTLSVPTQESAMVCMHNYARAKIGRAKLAVSSKLMTSSGRKAVDVLNCSSSQLAADSHQCGPGGVYYRMNQAGYCYSAAGENNAWGWGKPEAYAPTVRSTMSGWLHSEGHRNNILGRTKYSTLFTQIGVGLAKGVTSDGKYKRAWTAHFGKPKYC